jgi:hypothetical protein
MNKQMFVTHHYSITLHIVEKISPSSNFYSSAHPQDVETDRTLILYSIYGQNGENGRRKDNPAQGTQEHTPGDGV